MNEIFYCVKDHRSCKYAVDRDPALMVILWTFLVTVSATQNVNNFKFGRDQLIALNPGAHGNVASTFVPVDLSWVEEMIKEGSTTINNNTIRRRIGEANVEV